MNILIDGSESLSLKFNTPNNFELNGHRLEPGVELICRTNMTHLSFSIPNNFDVKLPIDHLDYEKKYLKIMYTYEIDSNKVWNNIGYCGFEFCTWLKIVHDCVFVLPENKKKEFNHLTNHEIDAIKIAYVIGIDLVFQELFN
jgi:hypothetical protein